MCFPALLAAVPAFGSAAAAGTGAAAAGWASVALTAASTAASVVSARNEGKYQEGIGKQNAQLQELAAKDAIVRGGIEEERYRRQLAKFQGKQRAAAGGAGRNQGTGTTLSLLAETAGIGEVDALTIRNNAMREAFGLQTQSLNSRQQARLAAASGRNSAIGTLLTGGAQAAGIYLNG